jgi:hypothetical protein
MQLPLRLQLRPSRCFFAFLAGGHILAGVAVCLLPLPMLLRAGGLVLLGLLFIRQWHACARHLPGLLLRRDGRLELMSGGAPPVVADIEGDTLVWPWLVVLHLRTEDGARRALPLFPDAFDATDAHRRLRVWLRWRAETHSV